MSIALLISNSAATAPAYYPISSVGY